MSKGSTTGCSGTAEHGRYPTDTPRTTRRTRPHAGALATKSAADQRWLRSVRQVIAAAPPLRDHGALPQSLSSLARRVALPSAISSAVLFIAAGAMAASFGSGDAAAAEPIIDAEHARAGVELDTGETAALAGGPVPALVGMAVPASRIGAGLHDQTKIQSDDSGGVHASLRQVMLEAANQDGHVTVMLNAPGTRDGRMLDVYQHWN